MLKAFLIIALVLLSLLGLSELVHIMCAAVLKAPTKCRKLLVLVPDNDNAEQQIAAALYEMEWHGKNYADGMAVLTGGISHENAEQLKKRFGGDGIVFSEKLFGAETNAEDK